MGTLLCIATVTLGRSQWPHGLRRGSAAASLLGLRVRVSPGAWMFVCLLWLLCVVRQRSLPRAVQPSSRGVLASVCVCVCVCACVGYVITGKNNLYT